MLNKIFNNLFGNAFFALSQLILFVYISRQYGVESLGIYSYSLAIATIMYMVSNVGLRNVLATDLSSKSEDSTYIKLRLSLSIITLFVGVVVFMISINTNLLFCILILLIKYIESIQDIYVGFLHRKQLFAKIRTVNFFKGAFVFLSIIGVMLMELSINSLLLILVLFNSIILCFLIYNSNIDFGNSSNELIVRKYKDLILFSFPFAVMGVLATVNLNGPRIFIKSNLGLEALAKYSAMYQIVFLGSVVVLAYGQAVLPHLTNLFMKGMVDKWLKLIIKSMLAILFCTMAVFLVGYHYGVAIMSYVFGTITFHRLEISMFILLGFASYFLNIMSYAFQSLRNGKGLVKYSILLTIIHLAIIPIVIVSGGMKSVIFVTMVYYFLNAILIAFSCRKILRSNIESLSCK
ncbi:AmrA [Alteromonadales bacterium TW-7]|nr:AmrA [Alteromonadales bacterium TW-7]